MLSGALLFLSMSTQQTQWKPVEGHPMTRWAAKVRPEAPHPEYPRPTLVREKWQSLNGLWDYEITSRESSVMPKVDQGKILVPFPIESALSGVKKPLLPTETLWYKHTFKKPAGWSNKVVLHFDAVDWEAVVWLNGKQLGSHRGGYDRFSFEVDLQDDNELMVSVHDPTDTGTQPRGKQVLKPEGIWYTAVSGIWQSVWMEPVGDVRIQGIRSEITRFDFKVSGNDQVGGNSIVEVTIDVDGLRESDKVTADLTIPSGDTAAAIAIERKDGCAFRLLASKRELWSPETPNLYKIKIRVERDGKTVDSVESYFAARKIEVKKDEYGQRLYLNGEPVFQVGPLDQGWWPDGLYTAPTDDALKFDIVKTRELGFNMIRKHVKVEPERWYYHCDVLGMLVWQDMPSGDKYIGGRDPDITRTPESGAQFETELKEMVTQFATHPSIVMWVPYNEGWGQWDTARIVDLLRSWDETRLINSASGWTDRKVGDVWDIHVYPGPGVPPADGARAQVLGEFGGLGLPLTGHLWQDKQNWGYRTYASQRELRDAYERLYVQLDALREQGLSAAVYTQTTDVEGEVNGLMTYDREVVKIDPSWAKPLHDRLLGPVPKTISVVPTSEKSPQTWRYTFADPLNGWEKEDYDDSRWMSGTGGFGQKTTPAPHVGTEWTSGNIWIRRTFELASVPKDPMLRLWHDEDAEVYINGKLVASFKQWVDAYVNVPFDATSLRVGKNTIAVKCKQTSGGQFIDVGLVRIER
jgi:hypothetical protein